MAHILAASCNLQSVLFHLDSLRGPPVLVACSGIASVRYLPPYQSSQVTPLFLQYFQSS